MNDARMLPFARVVCRRPSPHPLHSPEPFHPQALEDTKDAASTGVAGTIAETQLLIQLSEVCFGLQDMPQGQEVLVKAKGVQETVLQQLKQNADQLRKEKTRVRASL